MYRHIFFLIFTIAVPTFLFADIDDLVREAQAEVDNEAVVVYGGKVGKLDAIFHIEWAGDNLNGWYYYPARGKATRYVLMGRNPKGGVIILQEYSSGPEGEMDSLLSNSRLTKTVTRDRILWKGEMNNTNGRQLPISFSRLR